MTAGKSTSGRFFCFGPPPDLEEEAARRRSESFRSSSITSCFYVESEIRLKRRRSVHRVLSKIFKPASAALDPVDSKSSKLLSSEPCGKSSDGEDRRIFTSSSSSSSSSSESSSTASAVASALAFPVAPTKGCRKSSPERGETRKPLPAKRNYDPTTGLYLLLVSLSVMVFCGRLSAILWTSTWLYVVFRGRNNRVKAAAADLTELRPKGCDDCEKKRVVLEGLLERNRKV